MATKTKLAQQLSTVASTWIKDPFRPNMQLQTLLQSLATHPRLTPQAVNAALALKENEVYRQVYYPPKNISSCARGLIVSLTVSAI